MSIRFSKYFKLNRQQIELDFVDIPLDGDIPLFVDPYAISTDNSALSTIMNNSIIEYFELLISKISEQDKHGAMELLSKLSEPNDTHLGVSSGQPDGRGIGVGYADKLYTKLRDSHAVKTNIISDLSDFELMIEGIGPDRISDMTINIIKPHLIDYTFKQCCLYNIETKRVSAGVLWDSNEKRWVARYANLPVHNNKRIVLVPKSIVRFRMSLTHQEYHSKYILEYLQAEHLNANSGLVQLLKNGKKRVTKKDLRKQNPETKDFISSFTSKRPEALAHYKSDIAKIIKPIEDDQIESRQEYPNLQNYNEIIKTLKSIPAGNKHASFYHDTIVGALNAIFYPSLKNPTKEREINEGRKRIDIIFDNGDIGFFKKLARVHSLSCPYIMVECKNYSNDISNPEFDQLLGRFSQTRGKVGLLVCKKIGNTKACIQRCKDIAKDGDRKCIIVLADNDIINLLEVASIDTGEVDSYMDHKLREIMIS